MNETFDPKMHEVEKYLASGLQTQITPKIEKIASTIKGTTLEKVHKIFDLGPSLLTQRSFNAEIFRRRTASQILEDGYITGCSDAALVFVTLARSAGIPTKYVETIDKEWIKNGGDMLEGHAFTQVYNEEKEEWLWVDPMKREVCMPPENKVILDEGLDSWDIGIKDINSLKETFNKFREEQKAEAL